VNHAFQLTSFELFSSMAGYWLHPEFYLGMGKEGFRNIQENRVKRTQGVTAKGALSAKKSRDDLSPRSPPEELKARPLDPFTEEESLFELSNPWHVLFPTETLVNDDIIAKALSSLVDPLMNFIPVLSAADQALLCDSAAKSNDHAFVIAPTPIRATCLLDFFHGEVSDSSSKECSPSGKSSSTDRADNNDFFDVAGQVAFSPQKQVSIGELSSVFACESIATHLDTTHAWSPERGSSAFRPLYLATPQKSTSFLESDETFVGTAATSFFGRPDSALNTMVQIEEV
jgi:hypothetical protein